MSLCLRTIGLALILGAAATALAGDAYFNIPVQELKLVEGTLPLRQQDANWKYLQRLLPMSSYVVLDGPGEAYVSNGGGWMKQIDETTRIVVRAAAGQDVAGRLVVPNRDATAMVALPFTIPAAAADRDSPPFPAKAREAFFRGKIAYYTDLECRDIPGGAWFRHQVRLAAAETDGSAGNLAWPRQPGTWHGIRGDEVTQSYDLFSGGRAMSENLQLDRLMPPARPNEMPVTIDSINGITINEIDWTPLIKDAKPKLDPLSDKIPADQHVVFFPSFEAAVAVADETGRHDTPVLRLAEPRAEDARVVRRYEAQLGLSMSTLARLLGPHLVKSVALTGSDPFFPTGTDVAVLFEATEPAALESLLLGRIALAAATVKGAQPVAGETGGLKFQGFASPDRHISSYVARLDGAVVVTNSLYQLGRLAAVQQGQAKAIASLPEYTFFRIRYPLGDADETALVFLSDPTIRRWCGPRWRIADSRRVRARAVLAELQASQLDGLVRGTAKPGLLHTDLPILGGGELTLAPVGVASATFGTLQFTTPVGEIRLDEVTQAEADAYRVWRDGYQRNWSWGFDPIALRIGLGRDKLAADMTVMPLILGSQYRELGSLSLGGKFAPTAGDRHDALAQLILAIDRDSPMVHQGEALGNMLVAQQNATTAISLGWIGKWASAFADDDPFWEEFAKLKTDDVERFFNKHGGQLPVAVEIDVSDPLKLAAFLTTARLFIQQTAPNLTRWDSLTYKDQSYVRISAAKGKQPLPRELENLAIYYTTAGDTLTVTLSESLLKRRIDRALAEEKSAEPKEKAAAGEAKPWLGSTAALHADHKLLEVANAISRDEYQRAMQTLSWNNLPILNEWKRLYPDRDPVEVHRQVWGVELVCPGGGKYVWNEKYATMESTVYGRPGAPKEGPSAPPVLSSFSRADFGLTFEHQGLRARAALERGPAEAAKK